MTSSLTIYKDEELISILGCLIWGPGKIVVNLSDVKNPKAEFVQKFYSQMLREFDFNLHNLHQFSLEAPDHVQMYPESYKGVIGNISICKMLRYFFRAIIGADEFMPSDFFDPKPGRTQYFFSLLVNFYTVVNHKATRIEKMYSENCLRKENRNVLVRQIENMKTTIHELKMENAEFQIREEVELNRISESKGELQEVQIVKQELKNNLDALKANIAACITAIKDENLRILESNEKILKLKNLVVLESEKQEIEEREIRLASYKNDNDIKTKHVSDLKKSVKVNLNASSLLQDLYLILEDIQKEVKEAKDLQETIATFNRNQVAQLEKAAGFDMKIQQLNQAINAKQEKLRHLKHTWEIKMKHVMEETNAHKLSLEEVRRNLGEDEVAAMDMETEKNNIDSIILQLKEEKEKFEIFFNSSYDRILNMIENHSGNLQDALKDFMEACGE